MPLKYTTIASGGSVSGTVDLSQYNQVVAIGVPGLTSGDLLIQGAFDTTSASFQRLLETRVGSGDLRFATGVGSRMVVGPFANLPQYARLEISVAQTDNRTLTLLTTRR